LELKADVKICYSATNQGYLQKEDTIVSKQDLLHISPPWTYDIW